MRWERREGCCLDRCEIGQVTLLERRLGLQSNQRTSVGVKIEERSTSVLRGGLPASLALE